MSGVGWPEPKKFEIGDVTEPPEIAEQAAAMQARREHQQEKCADCGRTRETHGPVYLVTRVDGSRTSSEHTFVEQCPNAADPVLCKVYDGVLVPEAGCPVHDPDVVA